MLDFDNTNEIINFNEVSVLVTRTIHYSFIAVCVT